MWLPGTLPSPPGLRTETGVISHQKKVPINVFTTVILFHTGLMCFYMEQGDDGVVLNIRRRVVMRAILTQSVPEVGDVERSV